MKIRISLVDFLNAAPLGWSFGHGPHRDLFEVVPSTPAGCADQLASGRVDIGIIPSIEYQRIPGLQIIPGIGIASSSRVRSVILIRKKNAPIHSVALDTSSRTSAALIQILLHNRFGLAPKYLDQPPVPVEMLDKCDAALVIGDRALQLKTDGYEVMDLAEEWVKWQRLPFVFAVWACRAGGGLPAGIVRMFHEALDWGLTARDEIVASFSQRLNLPVSFLKEYLIHNIDYRLGESYWRGLERFYQLSYAAGLIPGLKAIRYADDVQVEEESPSSSIFQ